MWILPIIIRKLTAKMQPGTQADKVSAFLKQIEQKQTTYPKFVSKWLVRKRMVI